MTVEGGWRVRVTDDSKIHDLQKMIQILQTEQEESTREIEELKDGIKYISKKLSCAENERDVVR